MTQRRKKPWVVRKGRNYPPNRGPGTIIGMAIILLFALGGLALCAYGLVVLVVALVQDPAMIFATAGRAKPTPAWVALIAVVLGVIGCGQILRSGVPFMKKLLVGTPWTSRRRG